MKYGVAALCVWLAAGVPAVASPQDAGARVPVLDVPYVSQEERLCGGAAAAMLMRASGARGVYAEDFASLVDDHAGGIHTNDLVAALRARGYRVAVSNGTTETLRRQVVGGRPVLALLEDRPGRYHYVVVVGSSSRAVIFHDPARAPFMTRALADFDAAWGGTGRWMLAIEATTERGAVDASASSSLGITAPPVSTERDAATRRFAERDYRGAARLAERAAAADPDDRMAWRLLGASRYLEGDAGGALDAWNRAGDPRIDLVQIEGLDRTAHRAVERLIGIRPGTTLTRDALVRAERRLALLPAAQASRVSYTALPGNVAEVRGAVVERPLVPSRVEWIGTGARVSIDRELSLSMANAAGAGDRLAAAWRFWEGRPRVSVDYRFPSRRTGGVWAVSSAWQQERYADRERSEVRDARLAWTNWVGARLRVSGATGVGRWSGRGAVTLLDAGLEYRPLNDQSAFEASSAGALGSGDPFSTLKLTARWRSAPGGMSLSGEANVWRASSSAPPDQWPGAGAGRARPLLLRAHPLLAAGGRIGGPAFGRTVAQATVETEREVARRGFASLGIAAFTDAARAWRRVDGTTSPLHIDVGLGLRVRVAPGLPAIRLDVARGLRDSQVAVSAGWQTAWSARGTR